jgi:aspartate/methionine/tyrosine aminotransferase
VVEKKSAPVFKNYQFKMKVVCFKSGQPPQSLLPEQLFTGLSIPSFWLQYGNVEEGEPEMLLALAEFLNRCYKISPSLPQQTFASAAATTETAAHHLSVVNLCLTAGVSHGIHLVCQTLLKPGDLIFVENPTYFLSLDIFKQLHLRIMGVKTDEHGKFTVDYYPELNFCFDTRVMYR